ncbi:MAG: mechanosensitive ion channel family protein [Thermoanaerobaculia bacterium]|jgi:small-conductance mechanosensitive channel
MQADSQALLDKFLQLFGDNLYVNAAVLVVFALLAAKVVDLVVSRLVARWAKKSQTDLDDRIVQYLHKPLFVSVLFFGLALALDQLPLREEVTLNLTRSLQTIVLLFWASFALRSCSILLDLLSHIERRFAVVQPRTVPLFDNVTKIFVAGGAVYCLLLIWDIDVGAWLAGAGIMGIAVGFAAKDTLANLFAGVFIVADAPYQIGDFIVLDSGERGRVSQIGLRSTRLLTRDDIEITVPNAVIANAKITNESGGPSQKERVRVPVSVAYGSDIDRVREILMEVADANGSIDAHPEPRVRFRSFGESGLDVELLGWIHEPVLRGRVIDALITEIYKRFGTESIEIPYPKRDVYLHQPPASDP